MTIKNRVFIVIFTVSSVLSVSGCKQQEPYAHLRSDNHYTFYYNGGTYFSLGIPSGADIRVKSEEYSLSAGKNCGTISTVIKTGPEEYVSLQSGHKKDLSEKNLRRASKTVLAIYYLTHCVILK